MDTKIKKIIKWKGGNSPGPYRIEIHPTNRCNLKCKMCGTRASWKSENKTLDEVIEKNKERELSDDKLLKIIDEAIKMNVERILLTGGGEPFIRKNLVFEMMDKTKKNNIFGSLNTNGTLLNENEIEDIVDMKWDLMMFSVDGPNAKIHDSLRGVENTFEEMTKNLIRFKEIKNKRGSKKPEIAFNTVVTEENYRYIPELIEFAGDMGCNNLTLIPLINPYKHEDLSIDDDEELLEVLSTSLKIADNKLVDTNIEETRKRFSSDHLEKGERNTNGRENKNTQSTDMKNIGCFEPFLNMVIKMDGEVTPCCMIEDGPNLKGRNLEDIWNGKYYVKLRKKFRKNEVPDSCSECILSKERRNEELRKGLKEI